MRFHTIQWCHDREHSYGPRHPQWPCFRGSLVRKAETQRTTNSTSTPINSHAIIALPPNQHIHWGNGSRRRLTLRYRRMLCSLGIWVHRIRICKEFVPSVTRLHGRLKYSHVSFDAGTYQTRMKKQWPGDDELFISIATAAHHAAKPQWTAQFCPRSLLPFAIYSLLPVFFFVPLL